MLIGVYVGKLALASTYGAAPVAILLIWVYYSSQIVLLAAEFTHAIRTGIALALLDRTTDGSAAQSN